MDLAKLHLEKEDVLYCNLLVYESETQVAYQGAFFLNKMCLRNKTVEILTHKCFYFHSPRLYFTYSTEKQENII